MFSGLKLDVSLVIAKSALLSIQNTKQGLSPSLSSVYIGLDGRDDYFEYRNNPLMRLIKIWIPIMDIENDFKINWLSNQLQKSISTNERKC
jgi:hypothetical protein